MAGNASRRAGSYPADGNFIAATEYQARETETLQALPCRRETLVEND